MPLTKEKIKQMLNFLFKNKKPVSLSLKVEESKIYFKTSIGEFYIGEKIIALNSYDIREWNKSQYNPNNDFYLFDLAKLYWFDGKIKNASQDGSQIQVDFSGMTRWIKVTDKNIKKVVV